MSARSPEQRVPGEPGGRQHLRNESREKKKFRAVSVHAPLEAASVETAKKTENQRKKGWAGKEKEGGETPARLAIFKVFVTLARGFFPISSGARGKQERYAAGTREASTYISTRRCIWKKKRASIDGRKTLTARKASLSSPGRV